MTNSGSEPVRATGSPSMALYLGMLFGAEFEYMTVDAETLVPLDCHDVVSAHPGFGRDVKPELVCHQIELVSRPHASLVDLRDEMCHRLVDIDHLLHRAGACLLPISVLDTGPRQCSDVGRYGFLASWLGEEFLENASSIASDQINVGAPDEVSAFRIFRALVQALPVFIGLGAASPFMSGVANGVASNRLARYDGAFTRYPALGGAPPLLADLGAYYEFLGRLPVFNGPNTYYGYVRPMPHRGVAGEIRCLDKQPTVREAVAFFALAKAVALHALDDGGPSLAWPWACDPPAAPCAPFEDAISLARAGGLPDPEACRGVVLGLSDYLGAEERPLLGPVFDRLQNGAPAKWMTDFVGRHGMDGLHRTMIANLRSDYEARVRQPARRRRRKRA